MTLIIIILFLSIILAAGMLFSKAWEIETSRIKAPEKKELAIPELPFRHLEKNMLYLTKYIVQELVLFVVKYWFVFTTKLKVWFNEKWPKIDSYFSKKTDPSKSYRHSFVQKAILESKAKIKNIKAKVKREVEVEEKI